MDLSGQPQPSRIELALQRELRRGERVIWQGQPLMRLAGRAFAIYLFAIPWTLFALFWTFLAASGFSASWSQFGWMGMAFPMFGLPFIVIGIGMLLAPFLPLWAAPRTIFAVTDQRVLRIYLGRRLQTRSIEGAQIGNIDRSETRTGSGTLRIVSGRRTDMDGARHDEVFALGEVPEAMLVEGHVRELARRARAQQLSS